MVKGKVSVAQAVTDMLWPSSGSQPLIIKPYITFYETTCEV